MSVVVSASYIIIYCAIVIYTHFRARNCFVLMSGVLGTAPDGFCAALDVLASLPQKAIKKLALAVLDVLAGRIARVRNSSELQRHKLFFITSYQKLTIKK